VQVIEPVVNLKYDFGDKSILGGTFTADTMSGSPPNGALPALKPQAFVSPSSTSLVQGHAAESFLELHAVRFWCLR
jgi:hypothetical protein